MAKTLNDVKAAIANHQDSKELIELLTSLGIKAEEADSAKQGVVSMQTNHDRLIGELKAIGYAGGPATPFLTEVKGKLDKAKDLEAKAAEAASKLTGNDAKINMLETTIKTLTDTVTAEKAAREQSAAALRNRQLKDYIVPRLKDRVYGHDLRAEKLIESGRVVMNAIGQIVFKDGEQMIDLDKGIETYLQSPENKDDLKNTAAPGAGTGGQGGNSSGKKMAKVDFDKLEPAQRSDFLLKEHGEIV